MTTSRDSNGSTMKLPRGCLTLYTLRDVSIPLVRSKGSSPRTNNMTRLPAETDRQKTKNTNKMVPWLSSSSSERYVFQCRCQPTPTQPVYYIGGKYARGGVKMCVCVFHIKPFFLPVDIKNGKCTIKINVRNHSEKSYFLLLSEDCPI